MNQICRDIFRAIHEGKWLKIEYRNKADQVTKYWIGIRDIDPRSRTMKVDGLHLGQLTIGEYDRIFIERSKGIKGTIHACMKFNVPKEDVMQNLMEEFSLSQEEAEKYLEEYWK